ncbi:MAG: stage III sporulation protein AC [Bacillota bacterium]
MDIDIIFKIAGIGILVSIICQVLKKSDLSEIAQLVSLGGLIIVLMLIVDMLSELLQTIKLVFSF